MLVRILYVAVALALLGAFPRPVTGRALADRAAPGDAPAPARWTARAGAAR